MADNKVLVSTLDKDGKPITLIVLRPTNKMMQDANMVYNLKVSELVRMGAQNGQHRLLMRAELEDYLTRMGIWTLNDQMEIEQLSVKLKASELTLKRGGIKLSEGKALALQMAACRREIMQKYAKRQQFDSATIESQAENARFESLLIKCLVTENNHQFLKSHADYVDRQDEVAVVDGAKALAGLVYGLESDLHAKMFELQWMKDAGVINDEGRYVNKDNEYTDLSGRLMDKDGNYIDKDGNKVDIFGRKIDESGNLIVNESKPFIDDETGREVVVGSIGLTHKKPKKKMKG